LSRDSGQKDIFPDNFVAAQKKGKKKGFIIARLINNRV